VHVLNEDEIAGFLRRFRNFHDAVIVKFRVRLTNRRSAGIVIDAKDDSSPGKWTRITLEIQDLKFFKWREDTDLRSLILKLPTVIVRIGELFFVAFEVDGNGDLYKTKESLMAEASILLAGPEIRYDIGLPEEKKVSGTNGTS